MFFTPIVDHLGQPQSYIGIIRMSDSLWASLQDLRPTVRQHAFQHVQLALQAADASPEQCTLWSERALELVAMNQPLEIQIVGWNLHSVLFGLSSSWTPSETLRKTLLDACLTVIGTRSCDLRVLGALSDVLSYIVRTDGELTMRRVLSAVESTHPLIQMVVLKGCGRSLQQVGDSAVWETMKSMLEKAAVSKSGAVREQAFFAVGALDWKSESRLTLNPLVRALADGMADTLMPIRYASLVAVRGYMANVDTSSVDALLVDNNMYAVLVPPLCFNRYLPVDGIRVYAQETWAQVFPRGTGRLLVQTMFADALVFDVLQASSSVSVVREAVCHVLHELATKMNDTVVSQHVTVIEETLLALALDSMWSVRAAACMAAGSTMAHCAMQPQSSQLLLWDKFVTVVSARLSDPQWSVREDAAVALGRNVGKPHESISWDALVKLASDLLPRAKSQQKVSRTVAAFMPPPPSVNLLKQQQHEHHHHHHHDGCCGHDHDHDHSGETEDCAHSHSSSGTVLGGPTLACGHAQGSCSCSDLDHPELWEQSDGAIYLVRELARCKMGKLPVELLAELAELAILKSFPPQCFFLWETVWRQVPFIVESCGKLFCKSLLDGWCRGLSVALQSSEDEARNARTAALDCLQQLVQVYSAPILMGRCPEECRDVLKRHIVQKSD
jgi:HEAT repeat protein